MRSSLVTLLTLTLVAYSFLSPAKAQEAQKLANDKTTVALCGPDEPGRKMVFYGRVLDYQGKPLAKAAVMAHQTNEQGLYVPKGATSRVPRIRGVAITDDEGKFRFSTIWPGPYPEGTQPAHVHVGVMGHEHHVRFVTFWFEGDPRLTPELRKKVEKDPEIRIVKPVQGRDGVWQFEYDVRLEEA